MNEDGETGTLTVSGPIDELTAMTVLLMAAFGADSPDCGDPDCPVHGDGGVETDLDDDDLAGAA